MALSNELIKAFVKSTNDTSQNKKESTFVYATAKKSGNSIYAMFDGSDILTPVRSTIDISDGDRVMILVKNHSGTIVSNYTSPAVNNDSFGSFKNVTAENIKATNALIENVAGDFAIFKLGEFETLKSKQAEFESATAENFKATKGEIENLSGDFASFKKGEFEEVKIKAAEINKLSGDFASFKTGEFENLKSKQAEFESATAENFKATKGEIENLSGDLADYKTVVAEKITGLTGEITSISGEFADYKVIVSDEFAAHTARIDTVIGDLASYKTTVTDELIAAKGWMAEGAIGNAQISSVDANKLTAGTIDTALVTIAGSDGKLQIADNTMKISDANRVRVQVGKDASGDYTLAVWDKAGNLIWDALGATDKTIQRKIIRDNVIADDAAIQALKIDFQSFDTVLTDQGVTISGTVVQVGSKTLNAALSEQTQINTSYSEQLASHASKISANEKAIALKVSSQTYEKDKITMESTLQTVESSMNVMDGQITALVQDVTVLQGDYNGLDSRTAKLELDSDNFAVELSSTKKTVSDNYTSLKQYTDTAKSSAISTAAADATSKANKALADAKTDATTKADAAQTAAIASAAADATSKADSALSSAKSYADTAVDGVQVGGRNLAIGTNQGVAGWGWNLQQGTVSKTEVLEYGVRTCLLTRNDDEHSGWTYIQYININRDKWEPNTQYVISFDVKTNYNRYLNCKVNRGDNGAPMLAHIKVVNNYAKKDKWVTLCWLVTTLEILPADTEQVLYISNMITESGTFYQFRNLKIEKGTKATSWTPAPEDTQSQIDSTNAVVATHTTTLSEHDTRIAANENAISLKVWSKDVKEAVAKLEVGGRNLWLKTKEYDASAYDGWVDNNENKRVQTTTPYTYVNGFGVQRISGAWKDITQRVTIEPNTYYTLSAWIKWEDEIGSIRFFDNVAPAVHDVAKGVGNENYVRVSVTYNSGNATISTCRFECTSKTPYLIYGLKLEKGNRATDWTPAPEDIDSAIATVDGKFVSYSTTTEMQSAIEVAKSEINLAVSESYTTKQEFGALEIGGRNLIAGTSLDRIYSGKRDSGNYLDIWSARTINATSGTEYVLSFYAKADEAIEINCFFYSPNTTISSESSTGQSGTNKDGNSKVSIGTEWKRYWVKYKQTPTDECKRVIVRNYTFTTAYIKGVKFEEGNKPTDWTPAPEDADAKITSLETWKTEASQKITKDGIIATVGNYYAYQSDLNTAENRITQAESKIEQQAGEIALTVKEQDVTGNYIVGKLNLSSTTAKISAKNIDLSGYVTVSSLKTAGATTIDGSNITTGTISADRIDAESLMTKKLTATNLTVTGNSTVGGWVINSDSIYSAYASSRSGLCSNAGKYAFWAGETNSVLGAANSDAVFRVEHNGSLLATNATITGAITATSITAKNEYYIHASSGTGTKARALYAADGSIGSTLMVGDGFSTLHLCGLLVDKNSGQVLCGEDGSWGLSAGSVRAQGLDYGGQFNAVYGNYGVMFRNDGSNFYILVSNPGNQTSWQNFFPFIMNLASGKVEVKTDFYCTSWGSGTTVRRPVASASSDGKQIQWIESKKNSSGTYYITVNGQFAGSDFSSKNINCTTSDIRLKTNVVDCNMDALSIINQIQVREFDWKESGIHQKIGFVADELEAIDSNLAFGGGYNEDGSMDVKSVNEFYLVGYLTKGIQELHTAQLAQADELLTHKSQIEYLLDENAKLKKELKELKQIA